MANKKKDKPDDLSTAMGTGPTKCETRSQSRIVHTRHGTVKVVESVPVER